MYDRGKTTLGEADAQARAGPKVEDAEMMQWGANARRGWADIAQGERVWHEVSKELTCWPEVGSRGMQAAGDPGQAS